MKLPSWVNWHLLAQGAAFVVQYGNFATGIVPPKYHVVVLVAVSFAQWVMGTVAHYQQPPA